MILAARAILPARAQFATRAIPIINYTGKSQHVPVNQQRILNAFVPVPSRTKFFCNTKKRKAESKRNRMINYKF